MFFKLPHAMELFTDRLFCKYHVHLFEQFDMKNIQEETSDLDQVVSPNEFHLFRKSPTKIP